MPVRGTLVTEITDQLWSSGRFIQHDALWNPWRNQAVPTALVYGRPGGGSPLRPLSTNAMVLLNCREWLSHGPAELGSSGHTRGIKPTGNALN
jgi:hypothetical protein